MQGSAKRNLVLFRELCGEDALQKVILATTMWDKVSEKRGYRREAELMNTQEFWGWMVDKGSAVHRHYNTRESAKKIIDQLANHDKKFVTDLQRQLVDEGLTLDQTSAGKELQSELLKERERWAEQLRLVQADMEAAMEKNDEEMEKIMREERDRYTRMIEQAENKTAALRVTMESLIARRDERVARMEKTLREQQEKHAAHGNLPKRAADGGAVRGKAKELKEVPPVSVSWFGSEFSLTSGRSSNSNVLVTDRRAPPGIKASATIVGERLDDKTSWVARYSDESWAVCPPSIILLIGAEGTNCEVFAPVAPELAVQFSCYAYDTTVTVLKEVVKKSKKKADCDIKAVALGYGTSYLISYGSSRKLRYRCDLKNYYPQLQQFLEAKKPLNVLHLTFHQAVALNPRSKTDYILVFSKRDGEAAISWICSSKVVNKEIRAWANETGGQGGE
ncbi:G domain-containing protein [Fusarium falciforme]|uniref:G domain-containing protein n=1 Tax=Fusarium falciforme TaxID=195108 RepID=UPI002301289D|nr:G domain-containing protein [Fusarium falciforme]WAO84717.1 G domain-containing protein [Fusarium falciforme]